MDTKAPMMKVAVTESPSSNPSSTTPTSTTPSSASAEGQTQPAPKRILIIDSEPSRRKERVNELKRRGFAVFPALKLDEARSRCKRGGYDLIVVSAALNTEGAIQLCNEITTADGQQRVLLISPNAATTGEHNHRVVSDDPKALADTVEATLSGRSSANPIAA
jgi:PleD family two-component response regulator